MATKQEVADRERKKAMELEEALKDGCKRRGVPREVRGEGEGEQEGRRERERERERGWDRERESYSGRSLFVSIRKYLTVSAVHMYNELRISIAQEILWHDV